MQLEKVYEPSAVEDKIYKKWEDGHYFHAVVDPAKRPYSIVIPPPNITGQLHMGHALDETLQDIIIRTRRMQGYSALWLPGTDHASIATEAKIVEKLRQEGTSKEALGRDQFLVRAWQWKEQYGSRIVTQLKKLGSSCDWDRLRFTMDEGCNKAVVEVFCRLYEEGSIYQGERTINWCPHCNTSISDAEVEFEEQEGSFWHIRYPLKDGNGWLEIATTAPKRCWATRLSPSTLTTSATRIWSASCWCCRWWGARSRLLPMNMSIVNSAPALSRSHRRTTPMTLRSAAATRCPPSIS